MKLYLLTKKMTFKEDNIEHEIILGIKDEKFYGYDCLINLPDDDKFIKNTLKIIHKKDKEGKDIEEIESKIFIIREQKTWNSFPLYQLKGGEIIPFDWKNYQYFQNTGRRMFLAFKINELYNLSSEFKILRKTLKYIMDELKLNYPNEFSIMDEKIEEIIKKNPKGEIK